VRLIWGPGIASPSGVSSNEEQVLEFAVRPPFTAKATCERENAKGDCIPLTPMQLRFSAPVAWERAQQIRLIGPNDRAYTPTAPGTPTDFVTSVALRGPFPASATSVV